MITPTQFDHSDISNSFGDKHPFMFTCAMISACSPLFDHLDSNHDVEDLLIKEKVVRGGSTDSEYCQMFIYFGTRKSGEAFVDRLNAYLQKLAKKFKE